MVRRRRRRRKSKNALTSGVKIFTRAAGKIPIAGRFIKPIGEATAKLTGALLTTTGKLTTAELRATRDLVQMGTRRRLRGRRGRGTRKRRSRKSSTRRRRRHRRRRR